MTLLRHSEIYCAMIIIIYFNHLNARMAGRGARHRSGLRSTMYYKMATLSLCREFGVFCSQAGKSSRATQTSLEGMLKMKRSA